MQANESKTELRLVLYLSLGFSEAAIESERDDEVAVELAAWLAKHHGIKLRPAVVRRWLQTSAQSWQEPRASVGILILDWWAQNRWLWIQDDARNHTP
jgi:hypothetical protein